MNHPKPHPAVLTNTPIDSEIKITALANGFTYAIRLDDLAATVLTGNYDLPAYIAYFGKVVLMLCSGEMSISPTDQSHYPIISDNIEEDAVAFLHPSDVEELEEAVTFINVTDIRSTTQEEALNASSASFFGKRIISSPEIH